MPPLEEIAKIATLNLPKKRGKGGKPIRVKRERERSHTFFDLIDNISVYILTV
jgi:hypothetical protein